MKIEKYKFPDTIDEGMQYSDHWQMIEMLNRIVDGLNALLAEISKCSCPTDEERKDIERILLEKGVYGSSGMCDKHGRWEVGHPGFGGTSDI